jgi:hypothetical protein
MREEMRSFIIALVGVWVTSIFGGAKAVDNGRVFQIAY